MMQSGSEPRSGLQIDGHLMYTHSLLHLVQFCCMTFCESSDEQHMTTIKHGVNCCLLGTQAK